jgi:hypothetical protein
MMHVTSIEDTHVAMVVDYPAKLMMMMASHCTKRNVIAMALNLVASLRCVLLWRVLKYSLPTVLYALPLWAAAATTSNNHVAAKEAVVHVLRIRRVHVTQRIMQ